MSQVVQDQMRKVVDGAFAKPKPSLRAFLKSQASDPVMAKVSEPPQMLVPVRK